jgi:NNP family nitrate/nitrite transporter-like MFS transporter
VALAIATAGFALCFAVWALVGALAPLFADRYRLSSAEVGLLVAVPVLLGSLARVPLGVLTDRYGGRAVFSVLLLALIVPAVLAGLTDTYSGLLAVSFVLGLAGASFAVGAPFVSRWFPPESQGFALGVYGVGNIGTAIANYFAPRLAAQIGWRATFFACAPALLAMAILFLVVGRDAPGPRKARTLAERLSVFRRRPVAWVLALFYFVTFGGFVAIGGYLPSYLVSAHGLARTDAGARAAGFVVLATLARPVGGWLSDRVRATSVLDVVLLVVAALAVVLAFSPGMPVLTGAFLGVAVALGLGNGAVFKLVAELFPDEVGTVTGIVGAAGGLGGFFPPIVMGLVRGATGSYSIAFMLLSEFALLCLSVILLVLEHRAERISRPGAA